MKDPAILLYTGDFLNGCMDLTMEERGQYITLLCMQHQKGHLSDKTIRLSLGSASVDVLKKFVRDSDDNYFNERMEDEIQKRAHFIETRTVNGKKGGRPKKPNGKPKDNLVEDENRNKDYNGLFKKVLEKNSIVLPEGFEGLILEWLKYKSEKRQTYKETGLKSLIIKLINECDSDLETARSMMLFSTANNYDGLYKEKKNGTAKKTGGATSQELTELLAGKFGITK